MTGGYDMTSTLNLLPMAKDFKRKRFSSFDCSGGNRDWIVINPGECPTIADTAEQGCIRHIWCTIGRDSISNKYDRAFYRRIIIRMFWDGSDRPAVEAPIGDFFGMGHGICRNFVSAPLQMSPENGRGFNCWFPMPFSKGARIEVENQCTHEISLYYYIDWDHYDGLDENTLRFHASWNRELTQGISDRGLGGMEFQMEGVNLSDKDNYLILETEGTGHYVGCNINIHNRRGSWFWDWPGEGDDMIVVDNEPFPPAIHGTGTEDYVNMAFCPTQYYCAPYHGLILGGGPNWGGKITYYRYHILDPVPFTKSIRVSIEHGHANRRSDDWSSTAYWYQKGTGNIKRVPKVADRLPLKNQYSAKRLFGALIMWPIYRLFFS